MFLNVSHGLIKHTVIHLKTLTHLQEIFLQFSLREFYQVQESKSLNGLYFY